MITRVVIRTAVDIIQLMTIMLITLTMIMITAN